MPHYFIVWFTLALINAGLAQGKAKSGSAWFLISLLLGPVATLLLILDPIHDKKHLQDPNYFAGLGAGVGVLSGLLFGFFGMYGSAAGYSPSIAWGMLFGIVGLIVGHYYDSELKNKK